MQRNVELGDDVAEAVAVAVAEGRIKARGAKACTCVVTAMASRVVKEEARTLMMNDTVYCILYTVYCLLFTVWIYLSVRTNNTVIITKNESKGDSCDDCNVDEECFFNVVDDDDN
jgi:hypothetical protein